MRLPPDVIIPYDKLVAYLLVVRPENDKSQFLAKAGFTQSNPADLEHALRILVSEYDAFLDRQDHYGDFYRIEGQLKGTHKRNLWVVTIWIRRKDEDIYRFVTLKPWRNPYGIA